MQTDDSSCTAVVKCLMVSCLSNQPSSNHTQERERREKGRKDARSRDEIVCNFALVSVVVEILIVNAGVVARRLCCGLGGSHASTNLICYCGDA